MLQSEAQLRPVDVDGTGILVCPDLVLARFCYKYEMVPSAKCLEAVELTDRQQLLRETAKVLDLELYSLGREEELVELVLLEVEKS